MTTDITFEDGCTSEHSPATNESCTYSPASAESAAPSARMTVIDRGVVDGIVWVTCKAPMWGAVNGYVRVPDDHPWHGLHYDDEAVDVQVNGGLTFANADWIGFDTLHAGDWWPGQDLHFHDDWCTHWTEEMVAEEARSLARQVARANAPLPPVDSREA